MKQNSIFGHSISKTKFFITKKKDFFLFHKLIMHFAFMDEKVLRYKGLENELKKKPKWN